jgi:hypothetical protein
MDRSGQPSAGEEVDQLQEGLTTQELAERITIDAGHRHVAQRTVDDEHARHEEQPLADVRRADGIDEGIEHA